MPIWNVPGIAVGRPPSPAFDSTVGHLYLFTSPEIQNWISDEGLKLGVWPYINYPTFARAIARIAYCQAVANMGLDGFNRLHLPELILGTYPNIPYYVGVMRDIPPPPDARNVSHKIELQIFKAADQQYWLASVRLFAHSGYRETGMPIYRVIVGAPLS